MRTNVRNRLILAVPGACTHGDVLFRLKLQVSKSALMLGNGLVTSPLASLARGNEVELRRRS